MKTLRCPSDFKLHVTKEGDPMAILIFSGRDCEMAFVNLKTKGYYKNMIQLNQFTGFKSIVSTVSNIMNNSMVLQETRGKCCIVGQLNEVSFFFGHLIQFSNLVHLHAYVGLLFDDFLESKNLL